jgi:hypothetical protein
LVTEQVLSALAETDGEELRVGVLVAEGEASGSAFSLPSEIPKLPIMSTRTNSPEPEPIRTSRK